MQEDDHEWQFFILNTNNYIKHTFYRITLHFWIWCYPLQSVQSELNPPILFCEFTVSELYIQIVDFIIIIVNVSLLERN